MTPRRGALWGGGLGLLTLLLFANGLAGPLEGPLFFLFVVTLAWGAMLFPAVHRGPIFGMGLVGETSRPAVYFSYIAFVAVFMLAGSILSLVWSGPKTVRMTPPRGASRSGARWGGAAGLLVVGLMTLEPVGPLQRPLVSLLIALLHLAVPFFPKPPPLTTGAPSPQIYFVEEIAAYVELVALFMLAGWLLTLVWSRRQMRANPSSGKP